jgi:hypothetical protein
MTPLLYFFIGMIVLAGSIVGLAALWAHSQDSAGKAKEDADILKNSQDAQKRADDAAEKARKEDQKWL